jgi:mRNA degradation ribonuclease J1/J2
VLVLVALGEVGVRDGNGFDVVNGNVLEVVNGSRKVDGDVKSKSVSVNGSSSSEVEVWVLKCDVVRV